MVVLENFEFGEKTYEIRMLETDEKIIVRAYYKGKFANVFSHSIDKSTDHDFKKVHNRSALNELIRHVKYDITNEISDCYK